MNEKYLVVGSGSGVDSWWSENKQQIIREKWKIIPINNAWKLIGTENIHLWMVPLDYYCRGSFVISDEEIESINMILISGPPENSPASVLRSDSQATIRRPNDDEARFPDDIEYVDLNGKSGTMFVNAIIYLMKILYTRRHEVDICIVGSDFDYSQTDNTHWYSDIPGNRAEDDPMRYGLEWLVGELNNLKHLKDKYQYNIYNYSDNPNTLLPFDKRTLNKNDV